MKETYEFQKKIYFNKAMSIHSCRSLWDSTARDPSSCISVNVISNAEEGGICSDF